MNKKGFEGLSTTSNILILVICRCKLTDKAVYIHIYI